MNSLLAEHEWKRINTVASDFGEPGPTNLRIWLFSEDKQTYKIYSEDSKAGNHIQTRKDPNSVLFEFEKEKEYDQWRIYRE